MCAHALALALKWGYDAGLVVSRIPLPIIAYSPTLSPFLSTINGTLWVIYGLAVANPFVWAPNGMGAIFGAIQIALCLIFRSKPVAAEVENMAVKAPAGVVGEVEGNGQSAETMV